MKTYKQRYKETMGKRSELHKELMEERELSMARQRVIENHSLSDPKLISDNALMLESLKNLYYTMNAASPHWVIVRDTLVQLGVIT